jgi:hypothetical protein
MKRTIPAYVSVELFYPDCYVHVQLFRFIERDDDEYGRSRKVLLSVVGRRRTYKELTGHAEIATAT